jgi:glycosyltransferase involved in cell wall biosynthesis
MIKAQTHLVGVLSFWCLEEALIGSLFCKWSRIRHVSWVSGQDARRSNRYFRLIAPKPQELAAMSPFLADEMERNFGIRPAHIIANGIDASRPQASAAVRTIDLLGVGSLIPLKQYSIFIEIVGKLVETNRHLKAVICGAGPEKEMLQRLIDDLHLGENITLAGELPNAGVLQLMQQSKILLHPSSYEGYGSVILEALYSGCHVVSFVNPEKKDVAHWHIVGTRDEMVGRCQQLLTHETDFTPVVARDINESARSMMSLFGYPATV